MQSMGHRGVDTHTQRAIIMASQKREHKRTFFHGNLFMGSVWWNARSFLPSQSGLDVHTKQGKSVQVAAEERRASEDTAAKEPSFRVEAGRFSSFQRRASPEKSVGTTTPGPGCGAWKGARSFRIKPKIFLAFRYACRENCRIGG